MNTSKPRQTKISSAIQPVSAGTVALAEKMKLTKWTASHPVTKQLRLASDGSIEKTSTAAQLYEGTITRLECSPAEFIKTLQAVGANDCLSYGVPLDTRATQVLSRGKFDQAGKPQGATTRTKENMTWSTGPALMMIDYDPDGAALSRDELTDALYLCCPALREVAHVWTVSTSSCLQNKKTKTMVRDIEGQRVYIPAANGTDIPRAASVLAKRAWLNGFGYIKISKAGSMLPRCILDESVFQPNRIDYCAPAQCQEPLTQIKPKPELLGDSRLALDTQVALPDLDKLQEAQYQQLVTQAKAGKKAEAAEVRAQYVEQRAADYVARGMDHDTAVRTVTQALDTQVLSSDFLLRTEGGDTVSVGELLNDSTRWNRVCLADPIEPDYHSDERIARAYLIGPGRPYIHSFAHGGCKYYLSLATETIRLIQGERHRYMNSMVKVLCERGEFYRRGGKLVAIAPDDKMVPQSEHSILAVLDRSFRFEKQVRTKLIPADVPLDIAKFLAGAYAGNFPQLKAVVTAPIIVPQTGRLISDTGYDAETGLYVDIPEDAHLVNEHPSDADIKDALRALWWCVHMFPFAEPVDEAIMLTAMFTAVLRPLLPTAPGFAFDAPVQGSGKSLLMKFLAALIGTTPTMSPTPSHTNDEEMRKRLFAILMEGHPVAVLDNVTGEFDSAALAAMLTAEEYSDRVLGKSNTGSAPTNMLFLASGNNLILKGDLPRRILKCRIDPSTENPHMRAFPFDPVEIATADRQRLVAAALTLIKGYLNASLATRPGPGRTASFDVWDNCVRQTVCWLADLQQRGRLATGKTAAGHHYPRLTDPAEAINQALKEDPTLSQLGRLLLAWASRIGTGHRAGAALTAKNLVEQHGTFHPSPSTLNSRVDPDGPSLQEVLVELAGNPATGLISTKKLGQRFIKFKDHIVGGLCLRAGEPYQGAITWRVESSGELREFGELNSTATTETKTNVIYLQTKREKLTEVTKATDGSADVPHARRVAGPKK